MHPKKQKEKDRRRARKLADQAWDAVNEGNFDLAEKIIRRAVAAQEDNPVVWNDQGVLLGLRQKDAEADESFRAALSLAPTHAEPYAHLATLRLRQGSANEAVALQSQAVKYAPEKAEYVERLQAYQKLSALESTRFHVRRVRARAEHHGHLNWEKHSAPQIAVQRVETARAVFQQDWRRSRYFAAPIPGVVDQLRRLCIRMSHASPTIGRRCWRSPRATHVGPFEASSLGLQPRLQLVAQRQGQERTEHMAASAARDQGLDRGAPVRPPPRPVQRGRNRLLRYDVALL
jgi:hypothetical protein